MDYMLAIQVALGLLPQVFAIIKTIELPGGGAQKTQVISDIVLSSLSTLPPELKNKIPVNQVDAIVRAATSILVMYLNARGAFDPPKPVPAPLPVPVLPPPPPEVATKAAAIAELEATIERQEDRLAGEKLTAAQKKLVEDRIAKNKERLKVLKAT